MKVVIIDYGLGNINSIIGALKKININYEFSNESKIIEKAENNFTSELDHSFME